MLWSTFCELGTLLLPHKQDDVLHQPGECDRPLNSQVQPTIRLWVMDYPISSPLIFSQSFPVLPDTIDLVTPESQGSPYYPPIIWLHNRMESHCSRWFLAALAVSQKALQELHQQQEVCRLETFLCKATTLTWLWNLQFSLKSHISLHFCILFRHGGGEKGIARHVKLNRKVNSFDLENDPCWRFWWGTE